METSYMMKNSGNKKNKVTCYGFLLTFQHSIPPIITWLKISKKSTKA